MATSSRKGRVGQAQYWTIFGLYVTAIIVLMGFSLYSFANGELATGVTAILPIAPLGIYFRVIEMRRCRDIGWPAFLPWLFFVIPMGLAFTIRLSGFGTDLATAITALTVPLLVSLIDFVFSIVIGCIATKDEGEDYARIFGGEPQPARPMGYHSPQPDAHHQPHPAGSPGEPNYDRPNYDPPNYDRFDEAIARALEARRTASSAPSDAPEPIAAPEPAMAPTAHARAVAGFGRKMV